LRLGAWAWLFELGCLNLVISNHQARTTMIKHPSSNNQARTTNLKQPSSNTQEQDSPVCYEKPRTLNVPCLSLVVWAWVFELGCISLVVGVWVFEHGCLRLVVRAWFFELDSNN
jgi:hypothetical protein